MIFRDYNSKAVVRRAYEITPDDRINFTPDDSSVTVSVADWSECISASAYVHPVAGDFICHNGDDDVYHIERGVFLQRCVYPSDVSGEHDIHNDYCAGEGK